MLVRRQLPINRDTIFKKQRQKVRNATRPFIFVKLYRASGYSFTVRTAPNRPQHAQRPNMNIRGVRVSQSSRRRRSSSQFKGDFQNRKRTCLIIATLQQVEPFPPAAHGNWHLLVPR